MKKIFVATIVCLVVQISSSEAQKFSTREKPAINSKVVEPPPPPPPPPLTAVLPIPPIPAVPAFSADEENNSLAGNPKSYDSENVMIAENEKGFVLSVIKESNHSAVIVRKDGVMIKKVALREWMKDSKRYEEIYGKIPPPPPPAPPREKT